MEAPIALGNVKGRFWTRDKGIQEVSPWGGRD